MLVSISAMVSFVFPEVQPCHPAKLWRKMQDIQHKVTDDSIEKGITDEEDPPRVVTYTRGVNAH
jgi:hypothetical protein